MYHLFSAKYLLRLILRGTIIQQIGKYFGDLFSWSAGNADSFERRSCTRYDPDLRSRNRTDFWYQPNDLPVCPAFSRMCCRMTSDRLSPAVISWGKLIPTAAGSDLYRDDDTLSFYCNCRGYIRIHGNGRRMSPGINKQGSSVACCRPSPVF